MSYRIYKFTDTHVKCSSFTGLSTSTNAVICCHQTNNTPVHVYGNKESQDDW